MGDAASARNAPVCAVVMLVSLAAWLRKSRIAWLICAASNRPLRICAGNSLSCASLASTSRGIMKHMHVITILLNALGSSAIILRLFTTYGKALPRPFGLAVPRGDRLGSKISRGYRQAAIDLHRL